MGWPWPRSFRACCHPRAFLQWTQGLLPCLSASVTLNRTGVPKAPLRELHQERTKCPPRGRRRKSRPDGLRALLMVPPPCWAETSGYCSFPEESALVTVGVLPAGAGAGQRAPARDAGKWCLQAQRTGRGFGPSSVPCSPLGVGTRRVWERSCRYSPKPQNQTDISCAISS